jgi:hypothetical protein
MKDDGITNAKGSFLGGVTRSLNISYLKAIPTGPSPIPPPPIPIPHSKG